MISKWKLQIRGKVNRAFWMKQVVRQKKILFLKVVTFELHKIRPTFLL